MAFTLRHYNQLSEDLDLPPVYRGAVISVHGMNSRGAWQKELGPCLQDANFRHIPVDYGSVLGGVFLRSTRQRIGEKILAAYEEQLLHCSDPGVIGHSLGSLAVGHSLLTWPDLIFRRIVLFGSILPRRYPWTKVSATGQVQYVLNERARNDPWPRVAAVIIPGCGSSGCNGFNNTSGVVIERKYDRTAHSGLEYRLHYRRVWIPFLRGVDPNTLPA
jgi:hypothetical protein